jgi:hypothetical protein
MVEKTVFLGRLSAKAAVIGVFASLHVILYFMSFGLWRNWAIYLEPIEGAILGPWAGFSAALIGSVIARAIKPIDVWMFGVVAEPLGVLAAGFLAEGRWKPVLGVYVSMLTAYLAHPLGRQLPLWTILDIMLALALIYPAARLGRNLFMEKARPLTYSLILLSFVVTATDALTRVFMLIPAGLYSVLGWPTEIVSYIFIAGAVDSYIEDAIAIMVSLVVGVPLLMSLRRTLGLRRPLTSQI